MTDQLAAWVAPPIDGADLLDRTERFLGRFVAYPSSAAHVAHALWVAHTHLMDAWESTPRIACLSPEPGSGKSRALEVTDLLVPRPVHAVNTSPAYLFRKVSDPDGAPTLLYDEVDTVFGPKAKDNEDIRGMLNAGHRRGAMAGRCVVRGKLVETEELPAYCAVALAGLDDLPDTIASRSVVVRMRRRAPHEKVEPFRHRTCAPAGHAIRDELAAWTESVQGQLVGAWPDMPGGIEDRNADVWEALLAIADAAGADWPERAREAAVALVADVRATGSGSVGVRLLEDLQIVFDQADRLPTEIILERLIALEESPWADLRGKPLDARGLARRLSKYEIASKQIRFESGGRKGYERSQLVDAWSRYCVSGVSLVSAESQGEPREVDPNRSPTTSGSGSRREESLPFVAAPPVSVQNSETSETAASSSCDLCGSPLLLDIPGRTVCARCEPTYREALVVEGAAS